jgi:hypothetical protein
VEFYYMQDSTLDMLALHVVALIFEAEPDNDIENCIYNEMI